eukprot:1160401-Pelagomonas_calceolata.AAC.7
MFYPGVHLLAPLGVHVIIILVLLCLPPWDCMEPLSWCSFACPPGSAWYLHPSALLLVPTERMGPVLSCFFFAYFLRVHRDIRQALLCLLPESVWDISLALLCLLHESAQGRFPAAPLLAS